MKKEEYRAGALLRQTPDEARLVNGQKRGAVAKVAEKRRFLGIDLLRRVQTSKAPKRRRLLGRQGR